MKRMTSVVALPIDKYLELLAMNTLSFPKAMPWKWPKGAGYFAESVPLDLAK